jgi:hypothetical protein
MQNLALEIEIAEEAHAELSSLAEQFPERWGQAESTELEIYRQRLLDLYEAAGTPQDDRVAL